MAAGLDLSRVLGEVRGRIIRAKSDGLNEQNTKATLIEPVLRALGWDVEDVEEVVREYSPKRRDKPVDYALLVLREPRLLVEAKALDENLDDRRWANQIMGYAAVAGVEWIVLTDGNHYRIYKALESVRVEDKLLCAVSVTDDKPECSEILGLLSKDQLKTNRIDELWKAYFVDRQVRAALSELFGHGDDMTIVNLVRQRTKNLSTDEIRGSLRRCNVRLDFPTSPEETLGPVVATTAKHRRGTSASATTPRAVAVTLRQIIKAGLLRPPVALECDYKGHHLTARIEMDGAVDFRGKNFQSPSLAAGAARASVIGLRAGGTFPSTNGWIFWKYTSADGKTRPIEAARTEYLQSTHSSPSAGSQPKESAG